MKYFLITLILFIYAFPSAIYAQVMQDSENSVFLNPVDSENPVITSTPVPTIEKVTPIKPPTKKPSKPAPKNISININRDLIDFGIISPTSPTLRGVILSLSGTTEKQTIYIKSDTPLMNKNHAIIPDTACDQGGCSSFIASDWTNTLTFGIGFSCISDFCDIDFKKDSYRPFSNRFVPIYTASVGKGNKRMITLPLKLNVSGTQEEGIYAGSITILSVGEI